MEKEKYDSVEKAQALQVMIVGTLAQLGVKINRTSMAALAMILVHNAPRCGTTPEEVIRMVKAVYEDPGEGNEIVVGSFPVTKPV